ncbi:MAG: zinc ribbon domain-containing protein [Chloroflexi bacterium]|nr:zinc ribbon domain-containing protein [Chloroflexota bacterium]
MPLYEYYCRSCSTTFEQLRPMSRSTEPATCSAGHPRAERTVSLFAAHTRDGNGAPPAAAGGGCSSCAGGSCACGGH